MNQMWQEHLDHINTVAAGNLEHLPEPHVTEGDGWTSGFLPYLFFTLLLCCGLLPLCSPGHGRIHCTPHMHTVFTSRA